MKILMCKELDSLNIGEAMLVRVVDWDHNQMAIAVIKRGGRRANCVRGMFVKKGVPLVVDSGTSVHFLGDLGCEARMGVTAPKTSKISRAGQDDARRLVQ